MRLDFGRSLEDQLATSGHRPSGFDYMRIILAIGVLTAHAPMLAYGLHMQAEMISSPLGLIYKLILPMFFALSGFLVASSLERCRTLISFLGLRVIRIYPALVAEVLLSAIVIGPLVTTLPLTEYFTNPTFFKYLTNVSGHPYFHLPGVFGDNPYPNLVNQQLWTVPWELYCYVAISLLFLAGVKKHPKLIWYVIGAYIVGAGVWALFQGFSGTLKAEVGLGPVAKLNLVFFFLAGVGLYLFRKSIPFSPLLFWVSVLISPFLVRYVYFGEYICLVPVAYFTVYLGVCNPKRIGFIGLADYSYGIYLYGFVIQQSVSHFLPGLREWYWNLLISLPLAVAVGMMSWYFFEKPALKFRPQLKALEEKWLNGQMRARIMGFFGPQRERS